MRHVKHMKSKLAHLSIGALILGAIVGLAGGAARRSVRFNFPIRTYVRPPLALY